MVGSESNVPFRFRELGALLAAPVLDDCELLSEGSKDGENNNQSINMLITHQNIVIIFQFIYFLHFHILRRFRIGREDEPDLW